VNIGAISNDEFLGSFGFSYLGNFSNNNRFEIITDIFFNQGYDADIIRDKDYSQDILFLFNYSNSISKNFVLNFGLGISLIKYRYVYTPNAGIISGGKEYRYEYICKETEAYYLKTGLGTNPSWDYQVIFPFGISFSYKF